MPALILLARRRRCRARALDKTNRRRVASQRRYLPTVAPQPLARPCLTVYFVCLVCCGRCIGAPRRDGRNGTNSEGGETRARARAHKWEKKSTAQWGGRRWKLVSTLIQRDLVRASRVAEHCRVGVVAPPLVALYGSSRGEHRLYDSRERYCVTSSYARKRSGGKRRRRRSRRGGW